MANLKHVGRVIETGKKCVVAFRTIPGDANHCLVVTTENLTDSYHNSIINLVESVAGQNSGELADIMARTRFEDGNIMLTMLHAMGKLTKVPTSGVEMTPNTTTRILLSELNQLIASQLGVSVNDLAVKPDDTTMGQLIKSDLTNPKDPEPVELPAVVNNTVPFEQTVSNLELEQQVQKLAEEANRLLSIANGMLSKTEPLVVAQQSTDPVVETTAEPTVEKTTPKPRKPAPSRTSRKKVSA